MHTKTCAVLFVLMLQWILTDLSSASDKVVVKLESDKAEYVLGETVILQVAVHNGSEGELPVWVDALDNQIQIFLGSPGVAARELEIGSPVTWDIQPSTIPVARGEWKRYVLRLLYSFGPWTTQKRDSTLAFPEAGEYTIHVKYPLAPKREMFNSNTIHVLVKQPREIDAEIWQELNHEETLLFLQHGEETSQELPTAIAKILTRVPNSAYHPAMRWALGRYYYRIRTTGTPLPNLEDIENGRLYRKALGIYLQDPTDRLAGDERLFTRRVVVRFEEMTPVEEVRAAVEKQTGVPLTCDPALRKGRFSCLEMDQSLAEFMWRVFASPGDKTWVRNGRGYHLVPVTETDKQPGGPKPAGPPP